MRVLITGHRGALGQVLHRQLQQRAPPMELRGYDLADGQNILDATALEAAMAGCEAVVHLAWIGSDQGTTDEGVRRLSAEATRKLLDAAEAARVGRVIFASSVNALGIFSSHGPPDYFPIDDAHPCRPRHVYGRSKLDDEALCEAFTARTGIPSLCLRKPWVMSPAEIDTRRSHLAGNGDNDAGVRGEYACFLHQDDFVEAVVLALTRSWQGHHRLLLCSGDIATHQLTARALARTYHPQVPWRGGAAYWFHPYRSLVDASGARRLLGWRPRRSWHRLGGLVEIVRLARARLHLRSRLRSWLGSG